MKALLCLLCVVLCGCAQHTTEVISGSYGPFTIGESQSHALSQVEKIVSIRDIEPLTTTEVYLENPNSESIHAVDGNNGVLIWLDHNPWPLRVEFKNDVVVKKWGMSDKCLASEARMKIDCESINKLSKKINIGASRAMVYSAILNFKTNLSKQVGNFVVGLQDFRDGKSTSQNAYKELLMSNDVWRFEGLKKLSKYKNPFYSRVTLYFHDGRLTKIKHWSAPYEMP